MLIDTHCHLNFKDFKKDADEVIEKTLRNNVEIINVGAQYSSSRRAIDYAKKYEDGVWAAVGLHPIHIVGEQKITSGRQNAEDSAQCKKEKFDYEKYLELAKNDKVVAIGEVGLDYHHFDKDKKQVAKNIDLQKNVFEEFVRMSNKTKKPLAIHCWNADKKDKRLVGGAVAYNDILDILEKISVEKELVGRRGVMHSFIGSYKTAKKFVALGFKIGLNGIITYSESYDKLIKEVGLENIVLETDAPYLTPNPLERYSRNEPLNIKYVAQKIADILQIDIEKVETITTQNAKELFGI